MPQIKKILPVAFNLDNERDEWIHNKAKTLTNFSGYVKEKLIEEFEVEYYERFVKDNKKGE